jgi:hypothetical protein
MDKKGKTNYINRYKSVVDGKTIISISKLVCNLPPQILELVKVNYIINKGWYVKLMNIKI